ncbi:transmembrane protein, putative [Bodo saltans]|uniref:Transmembrane protein, putative n=1 Tax=Bodo saltans TaxID=75058 RepID=A0A0S4J731_BODSA|nr:transmembrane protein, putative [Bodo saltans]|eukprot:CUG84132.1 transmembrane protein, putative [Bodo saltans]
MEVGELFHHISSLGVGSSSAQWSVAPEVHVWIIAITLLAAAVGRDICSFGFRERWRWFTCSFLLQTVLALAVVLSVTQAAAAGLLSWTVLLGCCAFVVVMPRSQLWYFRAWTLCFLSTLLVASILTPVMLPALLPPAPLAISHRGHRDAFVVPFGGARVFFSPTQSIVANPVFNVYDNVQLTTLISQAPLMLHNTTIVSSGNRFRMFQLSLTLDSGSGIAVLGAESYVENCTIRCDTLPCVWLRRANAATVVLRDVRFAHQDQEWYIGDGSATNFCSPSSSSTSIEDARPPPIGCVDAVDESTSAFSSLAPVLPRASVSSVASPIRVEELRDVAPFAMLALEQVPMVLGAASAIGSAVGLYVVIPLGRIVVSALMLTADVVIPIVQAAYVLGCKIATVVSCRVITVSYFQRLHCAVAFHAYENDAHFATIQVVIDMLTDTLKDVHEVPIVSPSLYMSWNLERHVALLCWNGAWQVTRVALNGVTWLWPTLSSFAVGPLVGVLHSGSRAVGQLMWWSISFSFQSNVFDIWAWKINAAILGGLRFLLDPLFSLVRMVFWALWGLLRVYQTTSFSTHLLVTLLQSGLLGIILYRDFRGRVTSQKENQNWFMRSVATIPMAVAGMFRHYSARAATYLVVHLVSVILVVGTGVIPFGGALYSLALQFILPTASTYGWTIFFHEPETDELFWRRVSWSSCLRALGCVVIQKTLGDFVFHIVWEIFMGICMVGLGFLGMLWMRRDKKNNGSLPPTVTAEAVQPSQQVATPRVVDDTDRASREIH